ncbi:MAG: hypothetical protein ACYC64_11710 [Armatimonadota bacterium]
MAREIPAVSAPPAVLLIYSERGEALTEMIESMAEIVAALRDIDFN